MTAPTPAGPLACPRDANVFGVDSGTHPITGLPIARSQYAADPDVQAQTDHITTIAQQQGSAAAAVLLASVQAWLVAGNSTQMPPRATGV
jgi:hypothetical protein